MSARHLFAQLFRGRTDAYGTGKGYVVRNTLTPQHYADHLVGKEPGLGVFPMLDSNEVWWACVDIDRPDFELAKELALNLLPNWGWMERSRSGNYHVWFFFAEPVEAWIPRALCRSALEAAGEPNIEIFPKQDHLREGGLGNYVNLPLFGNTRPFVTNTGETMPPDKALVGADKARILPEHWRKRATALGLEPLHVIAGGTEFGSQQNVHPCALNIYENRYDNPLRPGARAVVIFSVAKQFLNWSALREDEARRMIHEINEAAIEPLPEREVDRIIGTVLKGRYTSTGCDDPLMADYILPDCRIAARG